MRMIIATILSQLFITVSMAAPPINWEITGLDMPESVIYDPVGQQLLVSNIDGHPMATNRQGYLSRISLDGKLLEQKWITGMNAPKGMAVVGSDLYIADLKEIHRVDLVKQTLEESIMIEKAIFLNDITADNAGNVYISDFMDHKIYRLKDGEISVWLEGELINHPNGLLADNDTLYIGNWGKGMRDDFTTETLGSLIAVDLPTKTMAPVLHGGTLGNLDGIVRIGDSLLINDWVNGKLFSINPEGRTLIGQFDKTLADIGLHNNTVYLPIMFEGKLQAINLKK